MNRRVVNGLIAAGVLAAGIAVAAWFGVTPATSLTILGLLVGAAIAIAIPIFAAVLFESRRLRRSMRALTEALPGARVVAQDGPGVWQWSQLEAERGGCRVRLRTATHGSFALDGAGHANARHVGLELVVSGATVPDGTLVVDGAEATVAGGEARALLAIPHGERARRRVLALIDRLTATG